MADLSELNNAAQIAGAAGTAILGIWRLVVVPSQKFREQTREDIKNFNLKFDSLGEKITQLDQKIKDKVADLKEEIKEIKDEYDDLNASMADHVTKIDAKNEKILDHVIRYFHLTRQD